MPRTTTREIAYAGFFTALMAVGAYVSIPFGSVPFTLQVLVVLLGAMVLGPRLALFSVVAYLCLGLVAPVYHGGASGLGVLFGPTGGYLWGFLLAAIVTGWIARSGRPSLARFVVAGLAGLCPIYVLGALWLALQLNIDLRTAFVAGVAPFIWIDALKAIVAGFAARSLVTLPLDLPALQRDH